MFDYFNSLLKPVCSGIQPEDATLAAKQRGNIWLFAQATQWMSFAAYHSDKKPLRLLSIAGKGIAFSQAYGSDGLVIPSELVFEDEHEVTLRRIHKEGYDHLEMLEIQEEGRRWAVFCREYHIGYLQDTDTWIVPLLDHGATIDLLRISGADKKRLRLGVHVLFSGVGEATFAHDRRRK